MKGDSMAGKSCDEGAAYLVSEKENSRKHNEKPSTHQTNLYFVVFLTVYWSVKEKKKEKSQNEAMLECFDFVKNSDNKIPLLLPEFISALTFANSSETDL